MLRVACLALMRALVEYTQLLHIPSVNIFNTQHAFTARVTVVVLCVCLSVCLSAGYSGSACNYK